MAFLTCEGKQYLNLLYGDSVLLSKGESIMLNKSINCLKGI